MDRHLRENEVVADGNLPVAGSIVEVSVLLETCQLTALEAAARVQGLTAGTLVRCLLREYLTGIENVLRNSCPGLEAPEPMDASVFSPLPIGRGE